MSTTRRRGRWGTFVALSLASVALVAFGTWLTSAQHFGTPARLTVLECDKPRGWSDYVFGNCRGSPSSATHGRYIEFWGAGPDDVGHEIDVHITSGTGVFDEAIVDGWILPSVLLAAGCVLAVGTVVAIVVRLRQGSR